MVELTHGGAWFKWSSLDPRDKWLAGVSLVCSALAALPIGLITGEWGFRFGFWLVSDGREPPPSPFADFFASDAFRWVIAASVVMVIASAVTWWLFSKNQDEMFNKIQNYAIAQGASWTFAITALSWLLGLAGIAPPLPLGAVVVIGLLLVSGFWFHAVRRWA